MFTHTHQVKLVDFNIISKYYKYTLSRERCIVIYECVRLLVRTILI
jgi:hypothetical protein